MDNNKNSVIGILAGSFADLSKVDFSKWGFQCFHIESEDLKEYVKEKSNDYFSHNWDWIFESSKKDTMDNKMLYVLVPYDINKLPNGNDVHDCRLALLVYFPSEIFVKDIIKISVDEDFQIYCNSAISYKFNPKYIENGIYDDYFMLLDGEFPTLNKFLELYYERAHKLKYVETAMNFYTMSWLTNIEPLSFVSCCIALEGIVHGKEQLSYRFKRNLAVLIGNNEALCEIIYSNLNNLYKLRSKIVHSDLKPVDSDKIEKYLKYARTITSRMIMEFIIHNYSNIENLNDKLNKLGFGDKLKISKDYVLLRESIMTKVKIIGYELPKIK